MYSSAASVTRGHHDRSSERSLRRFSAISSTPSSLTLLQPDRLSAVKLGSEWITLTMPWLVISQQERRRSVSSVWLCLALKKTSAASVTWYACRLSSVRAGRSCAMAPIESSAMLMQSEMVSETMRTLRHDHRPASVISLQPVSSSVVTPQRRSTIASSPASLTFEQRRPNSRMCARRLAGKFAANSSASLSVAPNR